MSAEPIDFEADDAPTERAQIGERYAIYFLGTKLEPYSLGRQLAFDRITNVRGSGVDNPRLYSSFEQGLTMLFVCTKTPRQLDAIRTEEDRRAFTEERDKWAEALNISSYNKKGSEVFRVAGLIMSEVDGSEFRVKPKPPVPGALPEDPNESGRDESQSS